MRTLTTVLEVAGLRRDKPAGKHRAADKIAELRAENQALLHQKAAADDAFILLHQERREALDSADTLRVRLADTELVAGCLARTVDDLTAERDGLYEEVVALRKRLAAYDAAEANAQAITVPPMVRDTSAFEDQATEPIPVTTLRNALGIGPVTDPGQTTWGARRERSA